MATAQTQSLELATAIAADLRQLEALATMPGRTTAAELTARLAQITTLAQRTELAAEVLTV